jgi:hypothetical protein
LRLRLDCERNKFRTIDNTAGGRQLKKQGAQSTRDKAEQLMLLNKLIGFFRHPPRLDHLDVVGRLTPSKNGNQEFTKRPDLNTRT